MPSHAMPCHVSQGGSEECTPLRSNNTSEAALHHPLISNRSTDSALQGCLGCSGYDQRMQCVKAPYTRQWMQWLGSEDVVREDTVHTAVDAVLGRTCIVSAALDTVPLAQ